MRLTFRQGIVQHQIPDFLNIHGAFVDLTVTDTPTILTFANGAKDYLYIETESVVNAWGPITPGVDQWLYWDIDRRTGQRSFGITLYEPVEGHNPPTSPNVDQHWFDENVKIMKIWTGTHWLEKIRVFACELDSGAIPISISIDSPLFTGTQAGLVSESYSGQILFDADTGQPLRNTDNQFVTTEDQLTTGVISTSGIKLAPLVISAEAQENLAAFTVVRFTDFGRIAHANQYTSSQTGQFGIIEQGVLVGEYANVIIGGAVTNPSWNWPTINANVYVDTTGVISLTPPASAPDSLPIGVVVDKKTIVLGVPQNKITNVTINNAASGIADETTPGVVRLNIAATNTLDPVVVGDNDPRMTDARTPLAHTHPQSDVDDLVTDLADRVIKSGDTMTGTLVLSGDPVDPLDAVTKQYADGLLASASTIFAPIVHTHAIADVTNLQTTLDGKVNLAGDTMTGPLVLSGAPTNPLEAVTKGYVDGLAVSAPTTQIISGTGTGLTSSSSFTYSATNGVLNVNYPPVNISTVGTTRIYGSSPSTVATQGASIEVRGGTGNTTGTGGNITIAGGTGGASAGGGNVTVTSGNAVVGGGSSGAVIVTTANAASTQNSGNVTVSTGTVSGGVAGTVTINPGNIAPVVFSSAGSISVNGSVGTPGQILTSAGAGQVTWANAPVTTSAPDTELVFGTGAGTTSSDELTFDTTTGAFNVWPDANANPGNISIDAASRASGFGSGGDLLLYGGESAQVSVSGGRLALEGGYADVSLFKGGEVLLKGGNVFGSSGFDLEGGIVVISGGDVSSPSLADSVAGTPDVIIAGGVSSGTGAAASFDGEVEINTNNTSRLRIKNTGDWEIDGSVGNAGYVITSAGAGDTPVWSAVPAASEPDTQVVYGTGTSVDSSDDFTYDVTDGSFSLNNTNTSTAPGNVIVRAKSVDINQAGAVGGNISVIAGDAASAAGGSSGTAKLAGGDANFALGPTKGGYVETSGGGSSGTGSVGGYVEIAAGEVTSVSATPVEAGVVTINGGDIVNPTDASSVDGVGDVIISGGVSSGTGAANTYNGNVTVATSGTDRLTITPTGEWELGVAGVGSSGQVLTSGGAGAAPTWTSAGGSVSEPANQLIFGTGAGVDSDATLTYNSTTRALVFAGGTIASPGNTSLTAAGNTGGTGGSFSIAGGVGTTLGGAVSITSGTANAGNSSGSVTISSGAVVGGNPGIVDLRVGTTETLRLDSNRNVILGSGAVATTAANGFLQIVGMAGTPTGTPSPATGRYPVTYDNVNNKMYVYNSGWQDVAAGSTISEPANQIVFGTGSGTDSSSAFTYNATTGALSVNPSVAAPGNSTVSAPSHSGSGNGGSLTISAGAGGTTGDGGNVNINGGTITSGTPGSVIIHTAGTERLEIAGNGEWQVSGSVGTAGYALTSNGAGVSPTWQAIVPTFPMEATSGGDEGAPAYTFSGDTNTGVFSPTADTVGITVGGEEVVRYDDNAITHSNGGFTSFGDAVSKKYIVRALTTDATPTELLIRGTDQLVLQDDSSWVFVARIIARNDVTGNTSAYELRGSIKRGTGAATTDIVGTVSADIIAEDSPGTWVVTAIEDTTNGALVIQVTGEAATDIRWVATVDTVEVTF